ncbi:MAG TPA: EAL domain-containing protein [Thermoanaerobaculia bacterium]|jgi:EAL domain-containing protein (putative c-di-GMP-specific phosphodiesterase class I)|nr:EAL domain-containing protein [Thermoanaerobaculia bacterium]
MEGVVMSAVVPESDFALDELLAGIDASLITPMFQPIVDLRHGVAAGFEVLSRGPEPYRSPEILFERARELGVTWEVERACRLAALDAIAALPAHLQRYAFFVNVSPDVMDAQTFLSPSNIVIEITERASIGDYDRFEALVRHYTNQGFDIALDDFGAGNSGLRTLISCKPHYLKLDMAVTRRVDREPYKQRIVRSMAEFAQNIGAVLIAEGVETWQEAEALTACGVEWAQGFLFARPTPRPALLSRAVSTRVMRTWGRSTFPNIARRVYGG